MAIGPEIIRLIEEIRDDRAHGAGELARQAVRVLRTAAENSQADEAVRFLDELREIGKALISARPPMVPIRNIVNRLLGEITASIAAGDVSVLRDFTISEADEIIDESLKTLTEIISYARGLIAGGDRIMTHSYSSTVLALMEQISSQPGGIEVIVTRSGPGRTGEVIARRLADFGLPVTFIDDTAAGLYISSVNRVLLGADTVAVDGVLNGVGSYPLAVLAARHGIPVYVLADTLKFDTDKSRWGFDTEDRNIAELADPADLAKVASIRNPHFDITPLELVTGVVTERGVMTPDAVIAFLNNQSVI